MSKLDDVSSALSKSYAAMTAVWPIVKKSGEPGALDVLKEALMACEDVLWEPGESSFPGEPAPEGGADGR
jgi:hypothetical protein